MNTTPSSPLHGPVPSREEVLIGRVTDGEATAADWSELESSARDDPAVWQRLAASQRAHARFEHAVEDQIAICELIEAPDRRALAARGVARRFREYGGWAAAAALGLAWLGVQGGALPGWGSGSNGASPGPARPVNSGYESNLAGGMIGADGAGTQFVSLPYDEAYDQYKRAGLASGRVLGELPMLLIEARPADDGQGQDVLFVRRVVERVRSANVNVLNVQTDEHGQPIRAEPKPLEDLKSNPV